MADDDDYHLDDNTVLYIMFIDHMTIEQELTNTEVVCRWYVDQEDQANDCSSSFVISSANTTSPRYCAFLVCSFQDMNVRNLALTFTISSVETGEHLAACFTDVSLFSTAETFGDIALTAQTADGDFAKISLHSAAQQRWQKGTPIVPQALAYFVNPKEDAQAKYLFDHIVGDIAEEQTNAEDTSEQQRQQEEAERAKQAEEKQRELEAQRRRDEDEKRRREAEQLKSREAADKRRREEEERIKREEHERQDQTRLKDSQRREMEERREEEMRRQEDERDRDELASKRNPMAGRWAEEDRRRLEEEEKWRQRQRERDEEAHRRQQERERWLENTARDRQKLEDERERLRQNAKQERARETAERERRSQERRKQQEVTAARLVVDGFGDSLSSRGATPGPTSASWNHTPGPTSVSWNHTPRAGAPDSAISTPKKTASTGPTTPQQQRQAQNHAPEHIVSHMENRQNDDHIPESHQHNNIMHSEHNHGTSAKTRRQHNYMNPASSFHRNAPVPGLEESDLGNESEGSVDDHFAGDDVMFGTEQGRRGSRSPVERGRRRSQSPEEAFAAERKIPARAPHPNRLLASATPARASSRRANNVAARLEYLKEAVVSHNDSFGPPAGLWTASDGEEETTERKPQGNRVSVATNASSFRQTSPANPQSGGFFARNSCRTSGKKGVEVAVQTTSSGTPAMKSVLAAALHDVNASDPIDLCQQQAEPVAAAEEGLLRLLLLQKQLHEADGLSGAHSSALADATAGLVPRMLQVLDVAKNVCEANRAKLKTFCQERDVNLESGGGYLQSQLTALDKLRSQYTTLLQSAPQPCPFQGGWQQGFGSAHNGYVLQPNLAAGMLGPNGRTPTPMRMLDTESAAGLWSELGAPSSVGPHSMSSPRRLHGPTPPHLGSGIDSRHHAPLDPGGQMPQLPALRGGGASTPPTAKFREVRGQGTNLNIVPALALTKDVPNSWVHVGASGETQVVTQATSSTATYPHAKTVTHRSVSPPKVVALSSGASTPRQPASPTVSEREERSDLSRRLLTLQQSRVAKEGSLPSRRIAAHQQISRNAVVGTRAVRAPVEDFELQAIEVSGSKWSASQPQEERTPVKSRFNAPPRGDGYLKILQKLQSHAPPTGGLRSRLLEGAGTASREKLGVQARRALEDSPMLTRSQPLKSKPKMTRSLSSAATLGRTRRRLAGDEDSDDSLG